MKSLITSILLLCLLPKTLCADKPRYWPLLIGDMFFDKIELALTDEEQQKGLMWRRKLEPEQGMLFVYQSERMLSFWMKNTLLPLDIVFLDRDGVVVAIKEMQPEPGQGEQESLQEYERRLPSYGSEQPAAYALELKQGSCAMLGLQVGDKIELHTLALQKMRAQSVK